MASILVDYENVHGSDGLKGLEYLNDKDTLIIFYSHSCDKIRADYIEIIEKSKCDFQIYKLVNSGKNALDFYIATKCGILSSSGEHQIGIISKDKGFGAITDFFETQSDKENLAIRIASNIENVLSALDDPKDKDRRQLIHERFKHLSIDAEHARLRERREFEGRIMAVFKDTEYEAKMEKILDFVKNKDDEMRYYSLYTGALHEFGREEGRKIYHMLKQVI